jgi:DNA-binding NtrC family response regulator
MLHFLQVCLTKKGFRATAVANVPEALEAVSKEKFDVFIVDVRLKQFSGISFLKSIKNRGDTSPVIMMSGYADRSEVQECLNLGAYDFLFKPFHMEVVIEVLQAIDKRNQRFVKMGVII